MTQLPNATDFEESILGTIIKEPFYANEVLRLLKPEYLYNQSNQLILSNIATLMNDNTPIDMLSLIKELKRSNSLELIGGAYYVTQLMNKGISAGKIDYHCTVVHQKYLLRELINYGAQMSNNALEPKADPFEMIELYNKKVSDLTNFIKSKVMSVGDHFMEMVKEIKKVQDEGLPTGLMSGFYNLDKITGGWQKGTVTVIAARPGMGKTAFALYLAKYPAINLKKAVGIFSLEMTGKQLTGRLSASESDINSSKINQKSISKDELRTLAERCAELIDAPIYIDDTPNLSFAELRRIAKKMKYDFNIELLIIDYLQLTSGDIKGNREQEISYISRNIKALSKELDIPIIELSQLSRTVESRADKRPMLSDLRESGAIEQDADNVIFLFRPAYYDLYPEGYPYNNQNLETEHLLIVDIAKGREIGLGELPLKFDGQYMKVSNYNLYNDMPNDIVKPLSDNLDFLKG